LGALRLLSFQAYPVWRALPVADTERNAGSAVERTTYRATKPYVSPYERTVVFRSGERLQYERRESEWDGWLWCTSAADEQAWVPEAWVTVEEDACVMIRDYTARELSLEPGDEVYAILRESGWIWVTTAAGGSGWVPLNHLEKR